MKSLRWWAWGWDNFQEFSFAAMSRITSQDLQSHTAPKVIQVFVSFPVSYSDSLLLRFAFWKFMHTYWPSQCTKLTSRTLPWQQWYNYIQRSQHFRNSKKASTRFWQISEIWKIFPKKLLGSVAEFRYEYYILAWSGGDSKFKIYKEICIKYAFGALIW